MLKKKPRASPNLSIKRTTMPRQSEERARKPARIGLKVCRQLFINFSRRSDNTRISSNKIRKQSSFKTIKSNPCNPR